MKLTDAISLAKSIYSEVTTKMEHSAILNNMTETEKAQYNQLSPEGKEEYNRSVVKHPEWSHNQHMAKASIMDQAEKTVGGGDSNVDPQDPKLWETILSKAGTFLEKIGALTQAIKQKFDIALAAISELIKRGIKKIGNLVGKVFGF